jgi:membrane-bound ClpP family serine protease
MVDPNIVYIVLLASLWLIVTAIHMPGTGVLELLAVVAAVASVLLLTNMPTQWGAAVILVVGTLSALVIPFLGREFELVAIIGLIASAIASIWLFSGMSVSPAIIVVTTGAGLAFQRFGLLPALDRQKAQVVMTGDQPVVGARGYVQKPLTPVGTVYVEGESWSARQADEGEPLPAGAEIVVVEQRGLTLMVESLKNKRQNGAS